MSTRRSGRRALGHPSGGVETYWFNANPGKHTGLINNL